MRVDVFAPLLQSNRTHLVPGQAKAPALEVGPFYVPAEKER